MNKQLTTALLCLCLTGCFEYSEGERTGVITKFSRKGFICKTWEGELNLGGFKEKTSYDSRGIEQTKVVTNVFEFTVENTSIIGQIQTAQRSGKRVTLQYNQELFSFCRSDSDSYFVSNVVVED